MVWERKGWENREGDTLDITKVSKNLGSFMLELGPYSFNTIVDKFLSINYSSHEGGGQDFLFIFLHSGTNY